MPIGWPPRVPPVILTIPYIIPVILSVHCLLTWCISPSSNLYSLQLIPSTPHVFAKMSRRVARVANEEVFLEFNIAGTLSD